MDLRKEKIATADRSRHSNTTVVSGQILEA